MNSEAVKFDLDTLDSILEKERSALLNGEIEELQTLAEGKNRLLSALENSDPISAGQIIPLKQKLRRNKALIESALEGIQAVASRIEDTRQLKKVMHTYDQQGAKKEIRSGSERSIEVRA